MNYSYKTPAYTTTTLVNVASNSGSASFKGLTYEALAGVGFLLSDSNMLLTVEAGYRSMDLKDKDSNAINMSGFVANVGASFSFSGE
jgi:hypothetical protein